jgi:hypothetical protein
LHIRITLMRIRIPFFIWLCVEKQFVCKMLFTYIAVLSVAHVPDFFPSTSFSIVAPWMEYSVSCKIQQYPDPHQSKKLKPDPYSHRG